jgi:hypothetical protein
LLGFGKTIGCIWTEGQIFQNGIEAYPASSPLMTMSWSTTYGGLEVQDDVIDVQYFETLALVHG